MSLRSLKSNHAADFRAPEGGTRAVTVPTAMAQRARQMNPEIRTAHPKPTRSKSFCKIIGKTVPPVESLISFKSIQARNVWYLPTPEPVMASPIAVARLCRKCVEIEARGG